MNLIHRIFLAGYAGVASLFLVCGFYLIFMSAWGLYGAIAMANGTKLLDRFDSVLESIGLLTIAVAALELGQTVLEEEIIRKNHISAPTRVRRFLSRFLIVVVVSLAIECLVVVFHLAHQDPALLPHGAAIGVAAAALLVAWGVFVRQNRMVEDLEPEAMEDVKHEDRAIAESDGTGAAE